jgi:DUF971 family protein
MGWPEAITDHQASGLLELRWSDGAVHRLPHWLLRARCRCGGCENLLRRTGLHPNAPFSIRLAAIEPVGDKGLNLRFDDGHGRGIYPWDYLRELGFELALSA